MIIDIGIDEKKRSEMAQHLNALLANEYALYTKTLNYHWNVISPHFGALHAFFKDQYEKLFDNIDDVAERVTSLGLKAHGTLTEFAKNKTLQEFPANYPSDKEMIKNLLVDHEAIIKQLRQDIDLSVELNDMGTNNFLAGLIEKHEKMAWMLRAHLV